MSENKTGKLTLSRDDTFSVVCEFRTYDPSIDKIHIGTGLFIASEKDGKTRLWIVTANHVAKNTNDNTQIIIATKEGKASIQTLSVFGPISNWHHHPIADVSAFEITPTSINMQFLKERFFPYSQFNLKKRVVSRDFELTSVGFPHGLGTDGAFSPFTFRSYACSGFVTLVRFDIKTKQDFFCMENPSVGGYSGGPVFDLGYSYNGVVQMNKSETICHGIMHGTISDDTGGKIAAVTPAFYLTDIIN